MTKSTNTTHPEKRRRGFTLLEVMIVLLVTGIVLSIAIPVFLTARRQSQGQA